MNLSTKIDNKKKDILVFGIGSKQGLKYTLSAEKIYSINVTGNNEKLCLNLHYNERNSYLFVNSKENHKFKAKDYEIVATRLCLGKVSKNWSVDNTKKNRLNGYVYDFSVDYDAIAVADVLDIHEYLMRKNEIVKMFGFVKQIFVSAMMFFGCNLSSVNSLKCISMSN